MCFGYMGRHLSIFFVGLDTDTVVLGRIGLGCGFGRFDAVGKLLLLSRCAVNRRVEIWLWLKKTVPKWNPGKWIMDQNLRNPSCLILSHTHMDGHALRYVGRSAPHKGTRCFWLAYRGLRWARRPLANQLRGLRGLRWPGRWSRSAPR